MPLRGLEKRCPGFTLEWTEAKNLFVVFSPGKPLLAILIGSLDERPV